MSRPERNEIVQLLERSTPGSSSTMRAHIQRCTAMYAWIRAQYPEVGSPWQARAKHLRSGLRAHAEGAAPRTGYDYWRAARAWAAAIGRWPDWEPHLRGPWSPDGGGDGGGRPAKVARRKR